MKRHTFSSRLRQAPQVLALCGALLVGASTARAQGLAIGVVDEDKLAQGFTRYRDALVKLDKEAQDLDSKLESREMLDGDSAKKFDALIIKETRSEAENTELSTLAKTGTDRRAEMLGLIGKATRSDADEKRLKELNEIAGANSGSLRSVQDQLYSQIKQRQEKIDAENTDRANAVIGQVAADKKLTLIWRKRAVLWSAPAVDITTEVLARLNKA
jgi:Skp family chaperone for outer membrane proteins